MSGKPVRWLQVPKYDSPVHTINAATGQSWCKFENNGHRNCLPIRLRKLNSWDVMCVNCKSLMERA